MSLSVSNLMRPSGDSNNFFDHALYDQIARQAQDTLNRINGSALANSPDLIQEVEVCWQKAKQAETQDQLRVCLQEIGRLREVFDKYHAEASSPSSITPPANENFDSQTLLTTAANLINSNDAEVFQENVEEFQKLVDQHIFSSEKERRRADDRLCCEETLLSLYNLCVEERESVRTKILSQKEISSHQESDLKIKSFFFYYFLAELPHGRDNFMNNHVLNKLFPANNSSKPILSSTKRYFMNCYQNSPLFDVEPLYSAMNLS